MHLEAEAQKPGVVDEETHIWMLEFEQANETMV